MTMQLEVQHDTHDEIDRVLASLTTHGARRWDDDCLIWTGQMKGTPSGKLAHPTARIDGRYRNVRSALYRVWQGDDDLSVSKSLSLYPIVCGRLRCINPTHQIETDKSRRVRAIELIVHSEPQTIAGLGVIICGVCARPLSEHDEFHTIPMLHAREDGHKPYTIRTETT